MTHSEQAISEAIERAMLDESEQLKQKLEQTQRALDELLEAIELGWEWVTNEHGEKVRVLNITHPNFVSAKREAHAVLGNKISK